MKYNGSEQSVSGLVDDSFTFGGATYTVEANVSAKGTDAGTYEMKLKPNALNTLTVVAEGTDGHIDFKLTVGEDSIEIQELCDGISEFEFDFEETEGHDTVRIKLDRISSYTPYFYELKIK